MPARYVLKNAAGHQPFMFNLKAGNNETILASETYSAKAGALNGIQAVRLNSMLLREVAVQPATLMQALLSIQALL